MKLICSVLSLLFAYFTVSVINGQMMTLPPLETLPPDINMNMSSIVSPYDATCMMADNSTDDFYVVYLGAVALNNDNECEVVCQRQILQQFSIMFGGSIRTRAVIIGTIYTASMPDNSTCSQTGTCIGGVCNISNQTTTVMPVTTTMNMTMPTNMTTNSTAG